MGGLAGELSRRPGLESSTAVYYPTTTLLLLPYYYPTTTLLLPYYYPTTTLLGFEHAQRSRVGRVQLEAAHATLLRRGGRMVLGLGGWAGRVGWAAGLGGWVGRVDERGWRRCASVMLHTAARSWACGGAP